MSGGPRVGARVGTGSTAMRSRAALSREWHRWAVLGALVTACTARDAPELPAPEAPPGAEPERREEPSADEGPTRPRGLEVRGGGEDDLGRARLGPGAPRADAESAASVGLARGELGRTLATVIHGAARYVLFTAESASALSRRFAAADSPRVDLFLARVDELGPPPVFARRDGVRLYALADPRAASVCEEASFLDESELRLEVLNGEIVVTAVASLAATSLPNLGRDRECGRVAFLVDGETFDVRARFTHDYHRSSPESDAALDMETTWRLLDPDAAGRHALRVTESYRLRRRAAADLRGERVHRCPYDPIEDRWVCPEPAPGLRLFRPDEALLRARRGPLVPPF